MKNNKKIIVTIVVLLLSFVFISCETPNNGNNNNNNNNNNNKPTKDTLNILAVTDFHGAIESENNRYGIARMANYIKSIDRKDPQGTVVVSAGDMFQGTAISNYNRGLDVINMMNMIGFDAMTIGNHEFDWYIDTILKYRDGDKTNGEANFPFLGSNIYQKSTEAIPEYIEPYTVLQKGDLTVGIIGYIGYGQESDIQAGQVADYQFLHPVEVVKEYVEEMRTEKDVDIVIAVGHDATKTVNQQLAGFTGDYRVDAIVNGHTHYPALDKIKDASEREVPVIQAACNGEYVSSLTLEVDLVSNTVTSIEMKNTKMDNKIEEDAEVLSYVTDLKKITDPLFNEVLGVAGKNIDRGNGAIWAANSLKEYSGADFAAINLGGIRSSAFPIYSGENVTISRIFQIMPFENCLKTVELKGKDVKRVLSAGLVYSSNVSEDNYKINGEIVQDNKTYLVATIDYVYDNPTHIFSKLDGQNVNSTKILFRDILIESVRKSCEDGSKWLG